MIRKLILASTLSATAIPAFAAVKYEITGSCAEKIETELDSYKDDENECIGGAYIDVVNEVNGNVYSISYGREVCEGYISGDADVTMTITKQRKVKGKIRISGCDVEKVEITDETGD